MNLDGRQLSWIGRQFGCASGISSVLSTNHVDFVIGVNSADCYDGSWIYFSTPTDFGISQWFHKKTRNLTWCLVSHNNSHIAALVKDVKGHVGDMLEETMSLEPWNGPGTACWKWEICHGLISPHLVLSLGSIRFSFTFQALKVLRHCLRFRFALRHFTHGSVQRLGKTRHRDENQGYVSLNQEGSPKSGDRSPTMYHLVI